MAYYENQSVRLTHPRIVCLDNETQIEIEKGAEGVVSSCIPLDTGGPAMHDYHVRFQMAPFIHLKIRTGEEELERGAPRMQG